LVFFLPEKSKKEFKTSIIYVEQSPLVNRTRKEDKMPSKKQSKDTSPFAGRPEQQKYYQGIINAIRTNPQAIVLAEGGTGLGKSRVLASIAGELASSDVPVILSAPTIQVMAQIASEFRHVHSIPDEGIAVLLGKSQFVDTGKVRLWIEQEGRHPDAIAAKEWLDKGAPPVSGGSYGERLGMFCESVSHLADDLETIAPSAPVADLVVDDHTPDEDPGLQAYQALRSRAEEAPVVVCSHAALVWDRRLKRLERPGLLPDRTFVLLADEAHQLAPVAESAHSSSCSLILLRAVLLALRKKGVRGAKTMAERLEGLIDGLRKQKEDRNILEAVNRENVNSIRKALASILQGNGLSRPQKSVLQAARDVLGALYRNDYNIQVRFSPVRRYPSIMCGPLTLNRFFEDLWNHAEVAVLCSGTLLLPGKSVWDGLNTQYIQKILNLPQARMSVLPPVHPKWAKNYELKKPPAEEYSLLSPPTENKNGGTPESLDAATEQWHKAVADKIVAAAETAAGGTLVLFNGYETLEAVDRILSDGSLAGRVVTQTRESGFSAAKRKFVEMAKAGQNPVWLATGPAWTGLDLADDENPPERDFLLTDIIIPRLPFGTEHSTIHERRKEQWGFIYEVYRAAFQFRQGVGRLIRREGVSGRRLWLLDARMWRDDAPWYMAYFQNLL
jgi:ATP-dependent DNA helicase DinG